MVCSGWLKNGSLFQRYKWAHQNVELLVNAMDWDLKYKDLINKTVYNPESEKCIMYWCDSGSGTATLEEFLDQELKKHEDDEKFNYCQWGTTDRAMLTTFTVPYEKYKETLIEVFDDLKGHSYIAQLKITCS